MIHEETLAKKIYDVMREQLKNNGEGRLRKIVVRCDSMETVDRVKVNEYWRKVATDPVYIDSHIEIHMDPPFGKCLLCNEEFELSEETARCPRCHHEQFKILHEPPTIETYEMEKK